MHIMKICVVDNGYPRIEKVKNVVVMKASCLESVSQQFCGGNLILTKEIRLDRG